ncbi:MAG: hypothetical protein ACREA5_07185 [Nitrosotalea sp.]
MSAIATQQRTEQMKSKLCGSYNTRQNKEVVTFIEYAKISNISHKTSGIRGLYQFV